MEELRFALLLEEMKKIYRQTKIIGEKRRENDAEHTFHIASMALFLEEKSKLKVDVNRTIKMLLIHDLVEIFAGDTFAYSEVRNLDKHDREENALTKLKSYLSRDNGDMLESLWNEFEANETNEAKFAQAMDRLQPILSNIYRNDGGTWLENKVKLSQVLRRIKPIQNFNDEIYDFVVTKVYEATDKGFLINDLKGGE